MPHPDDVFEISETLSDRSEIVLDRRAFLLGTAGLLTLPALAEAQAGKPQTARPALPPAKPYLMTQAGHSGVISSVAFSPNGKFVLTGSGDTTACIWHRETGKQIRLFLGHSAWLSSAVFSPNGKYVLTGSGDHTARLWEATTGKLIRKFVGHTFFVNSVAFSSDGSCVLTGSQDKTARLWDTETGEPLQIYKGHTYAVNSVAISADGKYVLTGGGDISEKDVTARLWDTQTGKQLRIFEGHTLGILSVAFSPNGQYVLTGSGDKTACLWETATGKMLHKFEGHSFFVYSVAFSPDGKHLLTGVAGRDSISFLWETETGKKIRNFEGNPVGIRSVAFSPDGKFVLTGSIDATACLWNADTGMQIRKFKGNSESVESAACSPDGRYLLVGSRDKTAHLWEIATGKLILKFEGHSRAVHPVVFSSHGKYMLAGVEDLGVCLWEIQPGKLIRTIAHKGFTAVAFSPDDKSILTGSLDKTAILWETETGNKIREFEGHTKGIVSVAFSPNGKYVLTGGFDKASRLWEAETGKQVRQFEGDPDALLPGLVSCAFSPDGRYLLTGDFDHNVCLWETETGKKIRKFEGHTNKISSVAFSPDGKSILTGSWDKTARLWETETGKEIRRFEGHLFFLTSVAFFRDGKHVLTGSNDNTTRLWETETGKELCSLISFGGGAWAVTDRAGRYDASNGGDVEGLHWVIRNQAVDLKQLKQRYYVPGLLAKVMQGKQLADVAAFDNVPMYPEVTLPERMPENGKLAISLTNQDGGIGRVQILLNGKEVQGDARGPRPDPRAEKVSLAFDLAPYRALLLPGRENVLEVIAYNGENWLASRGVKCVIPPPQGKVVDPPRLYAIVGGINDYAAPELHLRFAAGDAEAFATTLSLGAKRLFGVDKVEIVRLTGAAGGLAPTRANFEKAFAAAKKLRAQDLLLVYLAGHGVALGKGADLYCYLTQEARAADSGALSDQDLRRKTTLSSEELTEWIKACPAHEQVMILDTCAAGAAAIKLTEKRDVDGDQVRALDRLKDRTGFHILMGCAADRVSYEATRYGQGVLTYALLQGMKGAALGEGGQVDVSKLFQYAVDNVPRLAGEIGGIQRPQVCAPRADSFPVGRMEKEDQEKVPLEKTYPLILRPVMFNPEEAFDNLKLTPLVRRHLNDLMSAENRGRADAATVVYVDAEEMPGAITPNGSYTVMGDTVKVRLVLRQDEKTVETLMLEGPKGDPEALAVRITRAIAEAAQKR